MNRKLISLITAFAIIFISSAYALADSSDEARVSSFYAPDLDSVLAKDLAEEVYPLLSDSTRAVHDVNDIYLLLYDDIRPALMGVNSGGNYSLPRIAYWEREIYKAIYGQPDSVTILDQILDNLIYAMDSRYYTIPQLQAMTWNQLVDLNSTQGTALNRLTSISNQLTVLNSNVSRDITWIDSGSVLGVSDSRGGSYITSSGYINGTYFVTFNVNTDSTNKLPGILRLYISAMCPWSQVDISNISDVSVITTGGDFLTDELEVFQDRYGFYVYVYDFYNARRGNNDNYVLKFSVNAPFYYSVGESDVATLPLNSMDYHAWADRYYDKKTSNSLGSLDKLADVYASDDLIQAKQNQQSVEDGVLTDFTGSGPESMSLSDVGGVKNVSSNAKQFLGTGSSGSNALSVFNVNGQGLWQWFSQTTADNLDSTTPTRASDGYLTIYDQNLQNYLDGLGGEDNAR